MLIESNRKKCQFKFISHPLLFSQSYVLCWSVDNLISGEKVWWRKVPERGLNKNEYTYETPEPVTPTVNTDVGAKLKNFLDPMNDVKKYLKCETETLTLKKYVKKDGIVCSRSSYPVYIVRYYIRFYHFLLNLDVLWIFPFGHLLFKYVL